MLISLKVLGLFFIIACFVFVFLLMFSVGHSDYKKLDDDLQEKALKEMMENKKNSESH